MALRGSPRWPQHIVLVSGGRPEPRPARSASYVRVKDNISLTGWLGAPPTKAALPTEPALALIQCFYGKDATDSLCPSLAEKDKVTVIETDGGHHFNGDYDALAQRILDGFRRRAGGGQPLIRHGDRGAGSTGRARPPTPIAPSETRCCRLLVQATNPRSATRCRCC